jgi:hypothetical protein
MSIKFGNGRLHKTIVIAFHHSVYSRILKEKLQFFFHTHTHTQSFCDEALISIIGKHSKETTTHSLE